jgi:hypothetical protein
MSHLPSKPVLCIDFDGCINSYKSGWQEPHIIPDEPNPGAIEALLGYMEHFCVCIHTSRVNRLNGDEDAALTNMKALAAWLVKWGVPAARICTFADYQPEGLRDDMLNIVRTKPPAQVTIDDRGWTFDGTWPSAAQLRAFRPWNRRDVSGQPAIPPAASPPAPGANAPENVPVGPVRLTISGQPAVREDGGTAVLLPPGATGTDPATGEAFEVRMASPFPDDELHRRFRALDLVMRITAERAGIEGDPFSTENIEAVARHLEGGGGPAPAGGEGLAALIAQARQHMPGLTPEGRLSVARDLMDGYCRACGDWFSPDGVCYCCNYD